MNSAKSWGSNLIEGSLFVMSCFSLAAFKILKVFGFWGFDYDMSRCGSLSWFCWKFIEVNQKCKTWNQISGFLGLEWEKGLNTKGQYDSPLVSASMTVVVRTMNVTHRAVNQKGEFYCMQFLLLAKVYHFPLMKCNSHLLFLILLFIFLEFVENLLPVSWCLCQFWKILS
jgi:hypothetical protein